jgi:hypothetical protein
MAGAVVGHEKPYVDDDGAEIDGARSSTAVRRVAKCPICCCRLWMADVSVSSAVTGTEVTATWEDESGAEETDGGVVDIGALVVEVPDIRSTESDTRLLRLGFLRL